MYLGGNGIAYYRALSSRELNFKNSDFGINVLNCNVNAEIGL